MNLQLMPEQASKFAEDLDPLFFVLVFLTVVFTGLVLGFVLYLAIKYRRGSKADRSRPIDEHHILEAGWSLPPLFLGLAVFVWGAKLFADVFGPAPANAMEVFVIGKQWMWHLEHSNGIRENDELHIPVGRPVKLTMISQDVVHDFFCPEFRIHMDVVPGRYTTTWFTPTKVGKYHIFCAQYCGTNHSQMTGYVYVMEAQAYAQWLANGGQEIAAGTPPTLESMGKKLYEEKACGTCHDSDGINRGPSLVGLWGKQIKHKDGSPGIADTAYLRESIIKPSEKLNEKFQQVMPSYEGEFSEEQLLQLIGYIKSLTPGPNPGAEPAPTRANTPTATAEPLPRGAAPSLGDVTRVMIRNERHNGPANGQPARAGATPQTGSGR